MTLTGTPAEAVTGTSSTSASPTDPSVATARMSDGTLLRTLHWVPRPASPGPWR